MSVANQAPFQDFADLCAVARLDPPQLTEEQRVAQDALWEWFSTLSLEQRMQITAVCDSDWVASLIAMYRAARTATTFRAFPATAPAAAPASLAPQRPPTPHVTRPIAGCEDDLRSARGIEGLFWVDARLARRRSNSRRFALQPPRVQPLPPPLLMHCCRCCAPIRPERAAQQGGQARLRHCFQSLQPAGFAGHPPG